MNSLDNMSIHDAITLYYEKHHALREGDMIKILALKAQHPELFDKTIDAQIRDIIEYAKEFQASDRYKQLQRLEIKKQLTVINNPLINT